MDVLLLLGLDVLTSSSLILDFSDNEVRSKNDEWSFPLLRNNGHSYLFWPVCIVYTPSELRKVHRQFYHPHAENLYAFMNKSDPEKVSPDVMAYLQRITSTCDVCQLYAGAPHRFRVALLERDCESNLAVFIDLMHLEVASVLHVVDNETNFSAAFFLSRESADDVCEVFM